MFENIKEKGYVKLKTNFGEMNVELFCSQAPRTCYNFLTLAQERKYDDTVFHRLIPGFMVQGGDRVYFLLYKIEPTSDPINVIFGSNGDGYRRRFNVGQTVQRRVQSQTRAKTRQARRHSNGQFGS